MTKEIFIIFLFLFLLSCKSTINNEINILICGDNNKTWKWQERIINGQSKEIDRLNNIKITIFCDGTYGTKERHRNYWALTKNSDSIEFKVFDRIARADYKSKIIKLSNDSLVYETIIDGDTILDILTQMKKTNLP